VKRGYFPSDSPISVIEKAWREKTFQVSLRFLSFLLKLEMNCKLSAKVEAKCEAIEKTKEPFDQMKKK
jgi:hypothetical protein